jgi:hypothetical protein
MRTERTPTPVEAASNLPWQAMLRRLAQAAPRCSPPGNSWMFRALTQKLPLAARQAAF